MNPARGHSVEVRHSGPEGPQGPAGDPAPEAVVGTYGGAAALG